MKDKNTLIGATLLGILFVGMFYYQSTLPKPKNDVKKTEVATPARVDSFSDATQTAALDTAKAETIKAGFAAAGEEKTEVLENDKIKVSFSNLGGRIASVELKEYKTWDKKPLILFTAQSNRFQYILNNNGEKIATNAVFFKEEKVGNTISYKATAANGATIEQIYSLSDEDYKVDYELKLNGITQPVVLDWKSHLLSLEHSVQTERNYSALYYKYKGSDVKHLDEAKTEDEAKAELDVQWISFKQQFFNATLLSDGAFKKAEFETQHNKDIRTYVKDYTATAQIATTNGSADYKMAWYFGPNRYNILKKAGEDLEEIIKLGYDNFVFNWIKYITRFLTIPTFNILEGLGLNYGIIILLLTLLLKLLLTPLTWSSIKSAAYMRVLKPEMDELKKKYGDDQQKIAADQMKIYQEAGVNPLGGCLPMLLQLPILMSMYLFFPNSIELRQQPFLWATDLSSYDSIWTFSSSLPLIGNHISLFTILMTATSVAFAVYTQANSGMTNNQPGMQYMPYIMPVFMMFLFNDFPAALTYYYLLQNVVSMLQQWAIQKFFIDEASIHARIKENRKNPKPKSKFAQKFEEIQRAQQEQTKNKK
ncbi:MAG TPA: membrane protein insertase YidC [Chitinophagales bacterium]